MAGKRLNVGVVGYGMSAKIFHIPFITITPSLKLHSIVQRTPKNGDSAPNDHPEVKHYTDFKALIADQEVDVVVITTPPNYHSEQTKAALEAGKHVLTEKPFVPTVAEANELIAVAKENKRLICVFQNRRWDSDFLTLKHLISTGTLGRITEMSSHFDRYRPSPPTTWKGEIGIESGGSAIFDLGTHLIDQAYVLFGMPQSVHGRLLSQRTGQYDSIKPDSVSAELAYSNGLLVQIRASVLSVEIVQPRFWVRGSKGSFHKSGVDPQEDQLKAGMQPTHPEFGKEQPESMRLTVIGEGDKFREKTLPELKPETYKAFYAAFAKAVENENEDDVPVKAAEARDVLRIIEAVVESAKGEKNITLE